MATEPRKVADEVAGYNERLLVGQRYVLSGFYRADGMPGRCNLHGGREHHIDVSPWRQRRQGLLAGKRRNAKVPRRHEVAARALAPYHCHTRAGTQLRGR